MIEYLERRQLLSHSWFVATSGSNANPGTLALPFKTVQQAALLAQPGDTVYLRGGTYRETVTPARSGTAAAPITYSAWNNEIVTIDGADVLTGWTKNAGSSTVWSAPQAWDLGDGNNQVFVDGKAMNEAVWPNAVLGAVKPSTAAISSIVNTAPGTGGAFAETATISVTGLPGAAGAWNGATIHFGGGQSWVIQTGTVLSSASGTITFSYIHHGPYQSPVAGNRFYLTGKLVGLDSAGEWYRDPTTSRVNLWFPGTNAPTSHVVEVKRRQFGFELSNRSYINLQNIRFFATSIDTNAASNHLTINKVAANYVSQQMNHAIGWTSLKSATGVVLLGSYNTLSNSTINWSSGNGVYVGGSHNLVQGVTITNTDLSGSDEAAITLAGDSNRVLSNVIKYTGRDGIRGSLATHADIEYNTISNIGLQTTDLGAIYCHGTDSLGTIIAHNTISNVSTGGYGGVGLYLDNGSANYNVHDNVLTSVQIPVKLNLPSFNNSVTNTKVNGSLIANKLPVAGTYALAAATYVGPMSSLMTFGSLGGFRGSAAGINYLGQAVGVSRSKTGQPAVVFGNSTLTSIDPFGTGISNAYDINDAGQIVGQASNSSRSLAFLKTGSTVTTLGAFPGDSESSATAINATGQIAGVSETTAGVASAFFYSAGVMTRIGTLGGKISHAFDINDAGTVVGHSTVAGDRNAHAFSWTAGQIKDLGTLGGSSSYAQGINNAGAIVGASLITGNGAFHAFVYNNGAMSDLGTLPGYRNSVATGINAAGYIVGYAFNTETSGSRPFLYRNGVMVDVNTLTPTGTPWTVTSASRINDKNQIAGTVSDGQSRTQGCIIAV